MNYDEYCIINQQRYNNRIFKSKSWTAIISNKIICSEIVLGKLIFSMTHILRSNIIKKI